jgi:formate hydrogenlyase transcriptional activator
MTTNANPGIGIASDVSRPSSGVPAFLIDRREASATIEVSLAERLAFERLLGDLSALFANLPPKQVIAEIESALARLVDFLGFDRSSFGEFRDEESPIEVLCSVARNGIEPCPLGEGPPLPWYFAALRAGQLLVLPDLPADLPPEAEVEAEFSRQSGLRSNLSIPLRVGGRVMGVIAFAAFHHTRAWPEDLIVRLKIVGEVFAQALARSRRETELAAALAEITRLKERLEAENSYLRQSGCARPAQMLASRSARFNQVLDEIAQVAPTNATVLLLGETGTGKEVLADSLHALSQRRERPLIKVNCAALPASLIETELFGREKGAYTGALARQPGRFELADGGSLFLDEVGELPLELQAKLLRVLQDGVFERVGGTRTIRVDVRLIAATNRNLARAVQAGDFREDLFYRLNVFPVTLPTLRERREDIPWLAWEFIRHFSESMGKPIDHVAEDSMQALLDYHWPGNVRELRNLIERAMILARGPTLHVALERAPVATTRLIATDALADNERAHILQILEQTHWRIRGAGGAAERLGLKPTTLESRMKRLGLSRSG